MQTKKDISTSGAYNYVHNFVYRVAKVPGNFSDAVLCESMRQLKTAIERIPILEQQLEEQDLLFQRELKSIPELQHKIEELQQKLKTNQKL